MKWTCVRWENRTLYDTFDEATFDGPPTVPRDLKVFNSYDDAQMFLNKIPRGWTEPMYWGAPEQLDEEQMAEIIARITRYKDLI